VATKTFSVSIVAFATVLVKGVESVEEALEAATADTNLGDLQLDEAKIEKEVTTPEELESMGRHADVTVDWSEKPAKPEGATSGESDR
jgi:hypothetical protein